MSNYTLSAKITANSSDFERKIDDVMSKIEKLGVDTDKFNERFKQVGAVIAGAFAVDKIIDFGVETVEVTAKLNAMEAQFEQVFQGNDGVMAIQNLSAASNELGIHVNILKEGYNLFGAQVKGAGMKGQKAMEATDKATRLAADAAAFYDKSITDTSASLSSFMKGNFEAGAAIGVFKNAKQMDIEANKKYRKSWADLTVAERQWLLLDTVQKTYELNGAMGQAARESDQYEIIMGNLKATWEQFQQTIGKPILNITLSVMKALTGAIGGATNAIQALNGFFERHQTLATILKVGLGGLTAVYVGYKLGIMAAIATENLHLITKAKKIALDAADYIGIIALIAAEKAAVVGQYALIAAKNAYVIAAGLATAATTALSAAFTFLTGPVGITIAIIGGVIGAGVALVKNWDTVKAKLAELGAFFGNIFGGIFDTVKNVFSGIIGFLDDLTGGFFSAGANLIKNLWEGVKSIWADFKAWMAEKIGWLLETLGIWEKGASKIAQSQAQIQNNSPQKRATTASGQEVIRVGRLQYAYVGYKPEKGGKQIKGEWYQKLDGSHAGGLSRVPFDNYYALLHKDEEVLTASDPRNINSPKFKLPNISNLLGGFNFGDFKGMGSNIVVNLNVKLDEISDVSKMVNMVNNIPQVANAGMVVG